MSIHLIFPKIETQTQLETETESINSSDDRLQSLKFSAKTRRVPLLFCWIFMGMAVFVAGCLAHNRTTWQSFWNQEAVLNRQWFLTKIPFGSVFDNLATHINRIFVKGGWIVAGVVIIMIQGFYVVLVASKRDRVPALHFIKHFPIKKMIAIELLVLVLGTFYFMFCTWIFGKIAEKTGSCSFSNGNFIFPTSPEKCPSPAVFRGFDISGHCFLIVHSCLLALEYAAKVLFLWKSTEIRSSVLLSDKDSDLESVFTFDESKSNQISSSDSESESNFVGPGSGMMVKPKLNHNFNRNYSLYKSIMFFLFGSVFLLCVSEFLVYFQTILFYHTVLEKILGTFIGAGFWIGLFLLSLKYPHLF